MPDELVSQKLEKLVLSKLSSDMVYIHSYRSNSGFIKVQDGKSLCNFEKFNKCWVSNKWLWKMFMEK